MKARRVSDADIYMLPTTCEKETELRAIIDELRANNGELLRALLKRLSQDDSAEAIRLAEVLVRHPKLLDLIPH